ncbi:MAG: response regulator [Candidatus Kapabacteria bacterium]|jgi:CheY-like chemotaxis protein|nr:response regulator [Candidatus Kapabacteria bacterium]
MASSINKTILVIDDEEDVRNYLETALLDAGFKLITSSNGFEGLGKVKSESPDLVSLDLVMPKHSGVKFHYEMQKDPAFRKIPILIVTGHARDDLGKSDFDSLTMQGPGVYLEKPVSPKKYVSKVCQLLNIEVPADFVLGNDDPEEMRNELFSSLANADPELLKRALDALKKK